MKRIVLQNRTVSPDKLTDMVEERTKAGTFDRLEDVISYDELQAVLQNYSMVARYELGLMIPDHTLLSPQVRSVAAPSHMTLPDPRDRIRQKPKSVGSPLEGNEGTFKCRYRLLTP